MAKQEKNNSIIKVKNLSVIFTRANKTFKAVDEASFEVKEGEVFGLIGESGSGKTTIGRAIIGLWDHDGGYVKIENNLVPNKRSKINNSKRKEIAKSTQMIFQNPKSSLNPTKNVEKIITEGLLNFNHIKQDIKLETKRLEEQLEKETRKLNILLNPNKATIQKYEEWLKVEKQEQQKRMKQIEISINYLKKDKITIKENNQKIKVLENEIKKIKQKGRSILNKENHFSLS